MIFDHSRSPASLGASWLNGGRGLLEDEGGGRGQDAQPLAASRPDALRLNDRRDRDQPGGAGTDRGSASAAKTGRDEGTGWRGADESGRKHWLVAEGGGPSSRNDTLRKIKQLALVLPEAL